MSRRAPQAFRLAALAPCLAAAFALAACDPAGNDSELADLDNQLTGNDVDPALTTALEDQILVDPTLANQSNKNAVRPPETPRTAQYPAPVPEVEAPRGAASQGAPAVRTAARRTAGAGSARPAADETDRQHASLARASAGGGGTACAGNAPFQYDRRWAGRLSAAFAVYPGGQVTEAAGNNSGNCRVRVVTFATGDAPQRVLGWYADRARRAGYTAQSQRRGADLVLGGTNESDGGAYYLIVTPKGAGSEVALVANKGR